MSQHLVPQTMYLGVWELNTVEYAYGRVLCNNHALVAAADRRPEDAECDAGLLLVTKFTVVPSVGYGFDA